ncbi:MAG: hypothetical protein JNK15_02150 [Planctomycetes bacterium]|nr:hypothetical protein [Planctomycetota bacterium]
MVHTTHTLGALALFLATSAATAQWQLASPAQSPQALSGHGMTFHPPSASALLFGGYAGFSASNQTWSYDGATWTLLAPTNSPTAKAGVELVYDAARGVVVMYGGMNTSFFGGPSVDQTWEFDGATWTQVFPVTTPGGLGNYGACYDSSRSRYVLYGGSDNSFFPIAVSGTWEWNGTNWALVATATSPGPLERPAMCFHAGIGRTVMFGGIDPQIGGVDTTWLYDGTNWSAAPVTGSRPAVRTGAKMVYDNLRGVCVLTGGADPTNGNAIVDTWEFDGVGWTQVASATTGRISAGLAYLESQRRVVQFGGSVPTTGSALADTWDYSRAAVVGSGCAGSNGTPKLDAAAGPRLGQNYVQTLANLNPAIPVAVFVLSVTQLAPTSLAPIGMPGCVAHVSPDVLLSAPAAAGGSSLTFAVPSSVSLAGISLFAQGLSLDPGVNAASLTVSNALDGRLGS